VADSIYSNQLGLHRRLVWLTLLRIVLTTVLLAASTLILLKAQRDELGRYERILYGIVAASYLASLIYLLLLRSTRVVSSPLAYTQVAGDVLIASCLVYLTGGTESVVVFMFPLTVVSAAVLLYRRGAMVAAVLSSVGLLFVASGTAYELLPPVGAKAQALPPPRLAFLLFAHISAIFLTAALASYLAEQLRSTRERLSVREHDYLALELLHESIVRSIDAGILTVDRFGRVTFCNEAAERILGTELPALLWQPVATAVPELARQLREGPGCQRFEAEIGARDGSKKRLRFAITNLFDRTGKDHGRLVAFEDLSEMRAMEEAIKRSERLAAIGTMAAGLAHELRNPLASMSGSIQILAEAQSLEADEQRLMTIILREMDRLDYLVQEFLRFARPAPPQYDDFDLAEMIATTTTLFANDPIYRQASIETRVQSPLVVRGDMRQLSQVLWNLLTNAGDSMPDGGRILVEASRDASSFQLSVRDTGCGIEPADCPHVFDPFFTTKERGTGLGLAIVHGIVQAHGGEIEVESAPGRGTCFLIRLPSEQEEKASRLQAKGG